MRTLTFSSSYERQIMPRRRNRPRSARKISDVPLADTKLIDVVSYQHHPDHCNPNVNYNPNKTKCPRGITPSRALNLLKLGLELYTFSPVKERDQLPDSVWAVDFDEGETMVYEAKREGRNSLQYHGFPLLENDATRELIIKRWSDRLT